MEGQNFLWEISGWFCTPLEPEGSCFLFYCPNIFIYVYKYFWCLFYVAHHREYSVTESIELFIEDKFSRCRMGLALPPPPPFPPFPVSELFRFLSLPSCVSPVELTDGGWGGGGGAKSHDSMIVWSSINHSILFNLLNTLRRLCLSSAKSRIVPGSERVPNAWYWQARRLSGYEVLVGYGRAKRPCAARTPLFRLDNMQNGGAARFLPHPPQLRCFSFIPQIYKFIKLLVLQHVSYVPFHLAAFMHNFCKHSYFACGITKEYHIYLIINTRHKILRSVLFMFSVVYTVCMLIHVPRCSLYCLC